MRVAKKFEKKRGKKKHCDVWSIFGEPWWDIKSYNSGCSQPKLATHSGYPLGCWYCLLLNKFQSCIKLLTVTSNVVSQEDLIDQYHVLYVQQHKCRSCNAKGAKSHFIYIHICLNGLHLLLKLLSLTGWSYHHHHHLEGGCYLLTTEVSHFLSGRFDWVILDWDHILCVIL